MKPYCGERSIEFLYDYVDSWIRIIDMMENVIVKHYDSTPYTFQMEYLQKMVLEMTLVDQAIKELYRT